MAEFDAYALLEPGETIEEAPVWLGRDKRVPLVAPDGLTITLSRKARADMQVKVVYQSPIPAPIAEGQEVARLVVSAPDTESVEVPLVAGATVERALPAPEVAVDLVTSEGTGQ